jgi:glycosyltransferase involved in cell wall biosynthesis
MSEQRAHTIVVTIGPWHDKPWWWEQLARSPLLAGMTYERVSLDNRRHHEIGPRQLPALVRRLAGIVRRARRERIANIITFESDLSCYLIGLMQLLPGFRGPKHSIVQFISRESTASAGSRLKDFIARICLSSVYRVISSSRREVEYYRERFGWSAAKCVFVPLQTDLRFFKLDAGPEQDYIIAAGRSYRDYATLAQAVAGTGIRTLIVCGKAGPGVTPLPPEIEVITDVPLEKLSELMARARAVVLPLFNRRISTGQSVLLQGMALGRPVITTLTAGTEDYVVDGHSGLFVPPADAPALRQAILHVWNDPALGGRLGTAGRAQMARENLPVHYIHGVARAANCASEATPEA